MKLNIDIFDGIKYSIDALYKKDILNENTIIVIPVLNCLLEDVLRIRDNYKNKIILVMHQSELKNIIDDTNLEIIAIPDMMDNEEIFLMAKDIKEEYDNSYLFDLSNNKEYIDYFSKVVAKNIYKEYPLINKIYVPYIYGGMYKGLSKFFMIATDIKVCLINYLNNELSDDIEYDYIITKNEKIVDENNLVISCKH